MSQVNTSKITGPSHTKEVFRITPEKKQEYKKLKENLRRDRIIKLEKNVIELNKLFAYNNSLKNKVSELENKVQLLENTLVHHGLHIYDVHERWPPFCRSSLAS